MSKILLINGPNLNLLGEREPNIYGSNSLRDVEDALVKEAKSVNMTLVPFQSNHEGEIIDFIHRECSPGMGVIFNGGGYTHTSVAIRDAFLGKQVILVEVHVSNVYKREDFRRKSYFSDIAVGVIAGMGTDGYRYALDYFANLVEEKNR